MDHAPVPDGIPQAPQPRPVNIEPEPVKKEVKKDAPKEKVDKDKKLEREVDIALKDPTVKSFMDTFKAQILSVEQIKKTKK